MPKSSHAARMRTAGGALAITFACGAAAACSAGSAEPGDPGASGTSASSGGAKGNTSSGAAPSSSGSNGGGAADASVVPGSDASFVVDSGTPQPLPSGPRCVVYLHGRGGGGGPTSEADGLLTIRPEGNQPYDGGRVWIYFPDSEYEAMIGSIRAAIPATCGQIILRGFSNGGAAASKILCRGETFDGRLVGMISDDPVMDDGTRNCAPGAGIPSLVYETGALPPGEYQCSSNGFTCEGGVVVTAATYVGRMGLLASLRESSETSHACHEGSCDGVPFDAAAWWTGD